MSEAHTGQDARRASLRADCANCFGLCCVALAFAKSVDFSFDKDAGEPCVNLDGGFRCRIHPRLRESGMNGCTVFDCFGAGQKVSRVVFSRSWRDAPDDREQMFAVFPIVRQLQETLWYLNEALGMPQTTPMRDALAQAFAETERLSRDDAQTILGIDLGAHLEATSVLLSRASELVRAGTRRDPQTPLPRKVRPRADLIGARLVGQDLRGANLRGCYLIAADLHDADLRGADLIGADLRDADLSGADLSTSLFLTQLQVNAAKGNAMTRIPSTLLRPDHWAL